MDNITNDARAAQSDVLNARSRLAALDRSGLMDTPPEDLFDRAVRLAKQITGRPVALLSLVDDKRQFFKAQDGLTGPVAHDRGTPLSHSFCKHVVATQDDFIVRDATQDERVAGNGAIMDMGVAAYLGVPVRDDAGEVLGSLCVLDTQPHDWTDTEVRAMHDLRSMVETDLSLRAALRERQLLILEFNHRIRNVFTVFMGMVRLASREVRTVDEMRETLSTRLAAMDAAQRLVTPTTAANRPKGEQVELRALIDRVLAPFLSPAVTLGALHMTLGESAAKALALVFHELATNAVKYGGLSDQEGRLDIDWHVDDDTLILEWRESLAGIGDTARKRRPEDGTTSGFGSTLLRINIEGELGGTQERIFAQDSMQVILRVPIDALAG